VTVLLVSITPLPNAGNWIIAGLRSSRSRTITAAGQYVMPFRLTVCCKTNPYGCESRLKLKEIQSDEPLVQNNANQLKGLAVSVYRTLHPFCPKKRRASVVSPKLSALL